MSVDVEIKPHNIELNDRLEDYIVTKANKLERYLNQINEAKIELTHAKNARQAADRFVVQITIYGKGFTLRAEERTDDIYHSFDNALNKLHRQIERYKGKRHWGRGDGTSVAEATAENFEINEPVEPDVGVIARRKKFSLIPMDEREAIEQSNLLDHEDFFVFYNINTDSVNVLYQRRDGSYGLIETEIV